MRPRRVAGAAALAIAIAAPHDARAWEAFCRDPVVSPVPGRIDRYSALSVAKSICAQPDAPECADGLGGARGWFMGEHRYITDVALTMVGLGRPYGEGATVVGDPTSPSFYLFDYWVDGHNVDSDISASSAQPVNRLTPAGPAGMHQRQSRIGAPPGTRQVQRIPTLAELAEVPDSSYGLADWLMGNEACLAQNALLRFQRENTGASVPPALQMSLRDQINACHGFRTHMGSVNSTHFGTQAAATYMLHHGIAVAIAGRCKKMWEATKSAKGTATYDLLRTRIIPACEREALSFEAVGAHYIQDAWSSGHMWERWGSPVFATDLEGQYSQAIVGMTAGIEHGWRYIAEGLYVTPIWQHDQLCLSGPPTSHDDPKEENDIIVRYVLGSAVPKPAGGDLYLLQCNGRKPEEATWAVAGNSGANYHFATDGNRLKAQFQRMTTCIAFGFDEIYKAGPGPDLEFRPDAAQPKDWAQGFDPDLVEMRAGKPGGGFKAPPLDAITQGDITGGSELYAACFGQHMTNRSMKLGAGITDLGSWGESDNVTRGGWATRQIMGLIPTLADAATHLGDWVGRPRQNNRLGDALGEQQTALNRVNVRFARDLELFALYQDQIEHAAGKDGTESARLQRPAGNAGFDPAQFMASLPNPQAAADLIVPGKVEYLEKPNPDDWTHAPVSADRCTNDAYCNLQAKTPDSVYKGTFCDRTGSYDESGEPKARCAPKEAAVLRAYRNAELPYWCANDTAADFEAARKTCQDTLRKKEQYYPDLAGAKAITYGDVPECEACAEMIRPHLRASCNAKAWATTKNPRARSTCDVLKDGGVGKLASASLDANSVYAPYDPVSAEEAQRAARFVCAISRKIPTDAEAAAATMPAVAPFVRAVGTSACFNACDSCIACRQSYATGPLEVHTDPGTQGKVSYYGTTSDQNDRPLLFGAESDLVDVVAGFTNVCGVRSDGSVWCSGDNSRGQLGIGDTTVKWSESAAKTASLTKIVRIFALGSGYCAVDDKHAAWCWGRNDGGQVGDGTTTDRLAPVKLEDVPSVDEIVANAGGSACARSGTSVYCWGGGTGTGNAMRKPTKVPDVTDATQLTDSQCYLAGGAMKCWIETFPGACTNPPCCPNVLPVTDLPFAPAQINGNCMRSATKEVDCVTTTLDWPAGQTCPIRYKVATTTPLPYKADVISTTGSLVGRVGDQLFFGKLPAVVASESQAVCK